MIEEGRLYVAGRWEEGRGAPMRVVNPATGNTIGAMRAADQHQVSEAVTAASRAFPEWSRASTLERQGYLACMYGCLERLADEAAATITAEVGCPAEWCRQVQVGRPLETLSRATWALESYRWEERFDSANVVREPVGVVGAITPWNYPLHQAIGKVALALAAGCTVVLKPSELTPFSTQVVGMMADEAGLPPGVLSVVPGLGLEAGAALAEHRDVDLVSFTGSTRAGGSVMRAAASRVARVSLELGGKSPSLILPTADNHWWQVATCNTVYSAVTNAGQTCNALTRLIVPRDLMPRVMSLAREAAGELVVGDPLDKATQVGPLITEGARDRVLLMLRQAGVPTSAPVRPGWFACPTVVALDDPPASSPLWRDEIFETVLVVAGCDDLEQGVALANDTPYGLDAAVWGDHGEARQVARSLRAGTVRINGRAPGLDAPFGGCGQSGIGREQGRHGLEEFTEVKAIAGW